MKKIIQLSNQAKIWNQGQHKHYIPKIEIVLLASHLTTQFTSTLLFNIFKTQSYDAYKIHQINTFAGHSYTIFSTLNQSDETLLKCKVHIFEGISCQNIKDSQYKQKKKIINKLYQISSVLFLAILDDQEDRNNHLGIHFIENLDINHKRSIIIQGKKQYKIDQLFKRIQQKYEDSIRFQLVISYREMINTRAQLIKTYQPVEQLQKLENRNLESYLMKKHRQFVSEITSSLQGTYFMIKQNIFKQQKLKYSLKSLIFDRLLAIWETQYQRIIKSIDSIPLAQIQEQFKLYNSNMLNGFLSSQCFKSIFQSYLFEIQQEIINGVKQVNQIINSGVQIILNKYFRFLKIKNQYFKNIQILMNEAYQNFRQMFQIFVNSQIKYIYVSENDFWKINTINSSLYANRILIQIKYIGLAYVKKIADNLRESIPRMVGQLFINRLIKLINQSSFYYLQTHLKQDIELNLSEQQLIKFSNIKKQIFVYNQIIKYFSLKINYSNLVIDLNTKVEKYINCTYQNPQETITVKKQKKKGIFQKIKILLGIKKSSDKKRSSSADKNIANAQLPQVQSQPKQIELNENKKIIRQTQWLIALNIKKQLPSERVQQSAKLGFPKNLRPSIWLYICNKNPVPSVESILSKQYKTCKYYKQISKDLNRTPPHKLFKGPAGQSLHDVLVAYSMFNPRVGYTQGMNFLVSMIIRTLINYQEETIHYLQNSKKNYKAVSQQAFSILNYIVEQLNWKQMYCERTPKLFEMCLQLDDRIKKVTPKVNQIFQKHCLTTSMIFTEGLMTALTSKAPLQMSKHIFDLFLIKGESVIINTILRILVVNEKHIINFEQSELLFEFLKSDIFSYTYNNYKLILHQILWENYV